MLPICPECGAEQWHANSACDSGEPDYEGGSICNECGACVLDDDWEYDDEDA